MTHLVLGPLLRHVDERAATIWVETSSPCTVTVLDHSAPTFAVHGHHFALVEVEGLEPGSTQPYDVRLDGELAWPHADDPMPPPCLRTPAPDDRGLRIAFGSCRQSAPHDAAGEAEHGIDALRTLAHRLLADEDERPPDLMLWMGDQVYADMPTDEMDAFIRARRDEHLPPGLELADFEEYCQLYRLAWTEPSIRWLLSTVPSAMIFDDHDVRDDWNTSHDWREMMAGTSWWPRRIQGGLASYWVFQHLGNLSPQERAKDPLYTMLRDSDVDGGVHVDAFAKRADAEPDCFRWSYSRDLGDTRIIVIDSRAARRLTPGHRAMLDDAEAEWLDGVLQGDGPRHVLVGSSLPVLLPDAVHNLQRWNEEVCDGAWGKRWARWGEKARQAADLEHWAAFGESFAHMEQAVTELADGRRGTPPASLTFLSGDVHFSYLARVADVGTTQIAQAVCSPVRNPLQKSVRAAQHVLRTGPMRAAMRRLARSAGAGPTTWTWELEHGPWFDNAIATIDLADGRATVRWESPRREHPRQDPALVLLGAARLV